METDEQNPDIAQDNNDEDLDALFEDTEEQGIDWEAQAKKFKAIAERTKKKLDSFENNPTQEKQPVKKEEVEEQSPFQTMKEIALVTKSLDSDELDELELKAKELGIDPVKFARTSVWKSNLETYRSAKQKNEGTPAPSGRARAVKSQKLAETLASDTATQSEKQSAFEQARDAALSRR